MKTDKSTLVEEQEQVFGAVEATKSADQKTKPKALWPLWAATVALGVLWYLGLSYLAGTLTHESTDDAFIDCHVVSIAPKVSGQVSVVHVTDNQLVRKGDLLVEIDARDYEMRVSASLPRRLREDPLQILQTLRRDDLRPFVEIEYFNRNAAVVTDLLQRGRDRPEIHVAEARAFQIPVVGVEVAEVRPRVADDLRNGLGFRAHRFNVEKDFEMRRVELLHKLDCFGSGVDEVGFRG